MLQATGYVLLGNGIVAAGLAVVSVFLGARAGVYLAGLAAAVIAFVIGLPTALALRAIFPQGMSTLVLPLIDPAIEEPLRIFFLSSGAAVLANGTRITGAAIAFAFGYALFESAVKSLDLWITYSEGRSIDQMIAVLSAPAVVLMLHLALSLLAATMLAKGIAVRTVLLTTFVLHAAHNASVFWLPRPTDLSSLALTSVVRIAIFAAAIRYCLSALQTQEAMRAA